MSLSLIGLDSDEEENRSHMTPERHEICQMVRCRMQSLKQPLNDYGKYLSDFTVKKQEAFLKILHGVNRS